MDFKTSVVDTASSNIIVDVIFYDNPELGSFLFYLDSDNFTGADYVVTCRQDNFTVSEHDSSPGNLLHQGTPVVSASSPRYTFSFPASVLGLSSGTTVNYWFAWVGGDRMPDRPESKQLIIP